MCVWFRRHGLCHESHCAELGQRRTQGSWILRQEGYGIWILSCTLFGVDSGFAWSTCPGEMKRVARLIDVVYSRLSAHSILVYLIDCCIWYGLKGVGRQRDFVIQMNVNWLVSIHDHVNSSHIMYSFPVNLFSNSPSLIRHHRWGPALDAGKWGIGTRRPRPRFHKLSQLMMKLYLISTFAKARAVILGATTTIPVPPAALIGS